MCVVLSNGSLKSSRRTVTKRDRNYGDETTLSATDAVLASACTDRMDSVCSCLSKLHTTASSTCGSSGLIFRQPTMRGAVGHGYSKTRFPTQIMVLHDMSLRDNTEAKEFQRNFTPGVYVARSTSGSRVTTGDDRRVKQSTSILHPVTEYEKGRSYAKKELHDRRVKYYPARGLSLVTRTNTPHTVSWGSNRPSSSAAYPKHRSKEKMKHPLTQIERTPT